MKLTVVYTPNAQNTATSIYNFISNKFSVKAADKFIVKAEKIIGLISEDPLMFKASVIDENVRIALITK
jgi:plasmid stabilization system protein ParE